MKQILLTSSNFTFIILASIFLAACSSEPEIVEQPEKIYYDQAQRRMAAGNFFSAIESLEAIETRYPFGKYAEQAQIELIYAHFMLSEYEAAHSSAERFIRLHPRHPNIDYAYFMKGIASYTQDANLLARIANTDLSNRDISGAKKSFSELSEFLTRFPESQYAPYAQKRSIYLRNMIARNELAAADFYVSRSAYVAAIRRANYVIENIPNSSENYRALKILEKSYQTLGYEELLDDTRAIIKLNYADKVDTSEDDGWSWRFLRGSKPPQQ
ncbi:MAG: outer membrane protein assembly factor BamD [Gammaproteobacteria bacterium]